MISGFSQSKIYFSVACNSKNTRINKSRGRQINCDKLCQRNSFCVSCFSSRCIKTICHIRHTVRDFVTRIETLSTDEKITWGYHGKQNSIILQLFRLKVTEMAIQSKCPILYSLTSHHSLTRNGSFWLLTLIPKSIRLVNSKSMRLHCN